MNFRLQSLLTAGLCALCVDAFAQVKVGFVNTERLLRESAPASKVAQKLEQEFDKRRTELRTQAQKIETLQRQLERESLTLSEADRRAKERDLGALSRDFQRAQREYREDEDVRRSEEMRGLTETANRIIRRIAEEEKFDLIVQDAVYASPRIDLTDRVLKAMAGQ